MNKGKRPIGKILMILSVVFFYLPILYMIIFSFNDGKSLTSFTGFSLRWYKHMLESADMDNGVICALARFHFCHGLCRKVSI